MESSNDENLNPVTPGPTQRPNFTPATSQHASSHSRIPSRHAPSNFDDLDDNELCVLATMALSTIKQRGIPHVLPFQQQHTKQPDMLENAKIEQIICSGLKPQYDGSPEKLLPILNLIHIRRKNVVWYPATFIIQDNETIDIVNHFSKIQETTIKDCASTLWDSPDASIQCHTRGTPTYYARLLGVFQMNSITNDFALLFHSHIDQAYSSDGPLLLYTMCSHILCNHFAFVESIKNKI
jgi:hypothetical protein